MSKTRMTSAIKRSLELRLEDLDERIATLEEQRQGSDDVDETALLIQLRRERARVADALLDGQLIDDEPFDVEAIEIGDVVTVLSDEGDTDSYVLVADGIGIRARSDWVSATSPLGRALLGRAKGELIEVHSPAGVRGYVIVDFARASEAAPGVRGVGA